MSIETVEGLLGATLELAVSQLVPLKVKKDFGEQLSAEELKLLKSLADIAVTISKEERARATDFDMSTLSKEEQLAMIDEARRVIEKS